MDNFTIAQRLVREARSLEGGHANLYRVRAYRRAAETVMGLDQPLEAIVAENGRNGLRRLPGIGSSLAEKLETLVLTGEFPTVKEEALAGV